LRIAHRFNGGRWLSQARENWNTISVFVLAACKTFFASYKLGDSKKIASNEAFDVLSEAFKTLSKPFKVLSEPFHASNASFKVLSEAFDVLSEAFKTLCEPFKVLSEAFHALSASLKAWNEAFDVLSEAFKTLCEPFKVLSEAFDVLNEAFHGRSGPEKRPNAGSKALNQLEQNNLSYRFYFFVQRMRPALDLLHKPQARPVLKRRDILTTSLMGRYLCFLHR
jgi:hypothetical protein